MYEIFEKLLKEHNVTTYQVAKATGISTASFTGWKQGKWNFKQDKLQKIADYFDVSIEYLINGKDPTQTNSVELVKQICKERRIPISRLEQDCGFSNGYIRKLKEGKFRSDRLLIISEYLDLPLTYLTTGMESKEELKLTHKDEKDIKEILASTEQLLKQDGLMFDGQPASAEAIDSILSAMQIGMEMAKKKNKEKYTPKKYKKG